ncbi:MAG: hypothetical protein EOP88_01500 [Verrucomicrobiaceae bacterium]|nr:MAG: hypothetical protein EOP88_01500 [Verrucomicrobiaceae bacterium]
MFRSFKGLATLAAILLTGAWLAFLIAGKPVARAIAGRFQDTLQRAADGKFDDPVRFVHGRLAECVILLTLAVIGGLTAAALWKWLGKYPRRKPVRGLVMGAGAFVILNLLAYFASSTVLFWVPFYNKTRVDNFAQYHIKRTLFSETTGKRRAVLLGSSQTNRAIDEVLMNRKMGHRLWTTELAQPGARGFDMLTLSRDIPFEKGDLVICYLSEIMFYGKGSGIVAAEFMNFSEIPDVTRLHGWSFLDAEAVRSGLVGRAMPLYRFRDSLSHRALGWTITHAAQLKFDQSLEENLEQQAIRRAPGLGIGDTSAFEQAAFARMVEELSARGCTILVIEGQTHPAMRKHLNPDVVPHLHRFLTDLAARHPGGLLLRDGTSFFPPAASDFADLVHFTEEAQQRFTLELVNYLDQADFPQ